MISDFQDTEFGGVIPKTSLRFITCTRERTVGNIYNYDYWKCGQCGWHPGGSEGPPSARCGNCHQTNYTDDPKSSTMLIQLVPWEAGLHFKIIQYFQENIDLAAINGNKWAEEFPRRIRQRQH